MTEAAAVSTGTEQGTSQEQTGQSTGQASNQTWYGEVPQDDLKYLESKGWTGNDAPPKVFQSYKNLEKLFSQVKGDPNRVLMMPKDMANKEEAAEFYQKLGVPKDLSEYGLDLNHEGQKEYAEFAHSLNLNKEQAKNVMDWAQQKAAAHQESQEKEFIEKSNSEMSDWKREQGATFEAKLNTAKQAYSAFPELKEAAGALEKSLGTKAFMNLMHSIGSKIGEAGSAGAANNGGDFGMTPSAAKQAIAEFQGSTRFQALTNESHPGHQAARAEWQRLNQFAYPEMN
jgi:hypothetical protein